MFSLNKCESGLVFMNKWYFTLILFFLIGIGNAVANDPVLFPFEGEPQVEKSRSFTIPPPISPNAPKTTGPVTRSISVLPMDPEDLPFDDEMADEDASANTNDNTPNPFNITPQRHDGQDVSNSSVEPDLKLAPVAPVSVTPNQANGQGLTDVLSQEPIERASPIIPVPKVEGTWLGKITETAGSKLKESSSKPELSSSDSDESLETLVETTKQVKRRSNAAVFDVSGIMLRMSRKQVEDAMKKRGFEKTSESFEIPNFIKWRNEEKCRNHGVVGYERLNSCVVQMAKQDKHYYLETAKFSRFGTKEDVTVKFTSNFTNNKVYKVTYKSLAPTLTGNSEKATYLRNIKVYDFWKKVNQKYGSPDNKDEVIWGLGGNKPYLRAMSGVLTLEDPMLRELDFTRMSREDQRFINTDLYNF